MVGVVSYGFYIPKYRISVEEIAKTWGKNPAEISKSLNITEKAVAGLDEDVVTMGFEAACAAVHKVESQKSIKSNIGSVFFGSETFPYAVKPASTIVAEWLDIGHDYLAYDTEFACKAATGALLSAFAQVKAGQTQYSLVLASDKANAKPHDALEFTAGSGANAWLVGSENVILELVDSHSYSSDTPDFWRRAKADYPSHASRFTGKPAYFHHIHGSAKALLAKTKMKPKDFTYGVFHMPNGRFPLEVGLSLGFTKEQIMPSLIVSQLGNSYSASALMGLVAVLEKVKAGDTIFFASYGSGAGSDAMVFKVTEEIKNKKIKNKNEFSKVIQNKTYIDYATYMRFMDVV
jgi:hydroxymethylglutaryl-CoA synthase